MCAPGYEVTMQVWVEHTVTENLLITPESFVCTVQPPVVTQSDRIALEMSLDYLAKMKYLAHLRKLAEHSLKVELMLNTQQFVIRSKIERWKSPPKQDGSCIEVVCYPSQPYAA